MKQIRILLADDHNVLRQGMAQALDTQPDMTVVAQAKNGQEAIELTAKYQPTLVLMDINMPQVDGVQATQQITEKWPHIHLMILTMYRRDDYIFEAIKVGASGYLLKDVELDELLTAIRAVARGEAVIDSAIAKRVLAALRPSQKKDEPDLSERDIEILRLLAKGLPNQEIALQLDIAEKTVRNRLSLIFRRLHVENRTQAALYAVQKGLTEEEN